ncbi:AMP-dependent synthetase [Acuticoccus sediminis]|uniref:3-methylmercaptopropionyl-CoA ligase n=1 Tax=Acuticoccus sediminis TaxID=2184697 RepID=A0A8B2NVA4_9HYPH|nr:AMP-binding protein [Acuticoccus sediminis]RAI04098.1 AMP-dependent synthetase [Acuticoccus sediminis]
MNLANWLARSATLTPDAPALLHGAEVVATYAGFADRAARIATGLHGRGAVAGDRLALFMSNTPDYLAIWWGAWWAGLAVVPINSKLHEKEAAYIAQHSGARFAAVSVANLVAMSLTYLADVDEVYPTDAALYAAPMSHGAGCYNLMHVMKGARHVVPRSGGFEPAEILELAGSVGSIHMFAAPTMVRRLITHAEAVGHRGEGIRTIVYGGGPMYVADIEKAVDQFGPRFVQIYGQGETPMTITGLPRHLVADRTHPRWRERLGSVGIAMSSMEVRTVDEAGRDVPEDEVGEVICRGPSVMSAYWQNPDATASTLRDGWLWTGDMGALDAEGFLTLKDRSKDMIVSGGTNIYPREVEEVLLRHPDVAEVAVVGRPHEDWGEEVVAFVVGRAGPVDPAALDALCQSEIARFKRPKEYIVVEALPKNNYGKVLKTALRERFAKAPA